MKLRNLVITFLVLIWHTNISGQIFRSFSQQPDKYPEELHTFMGPNLANQNQIIVNEFISRWINGEISDTNKTEIIVLSNHLLRKNGRPVPHFILFFRNLKSFSERQSEESNYINWKEGLYYLSESREYTIQDIENYLRFSLDLLTGNILHKSSSILWKTSTRDFRFEFDDSLCIVFENTDLICIAARDSMKIFGTGGLYNPLTHSWFGQGGTATWQRSGFDINEVYAELNRYLINMRLTGYTADSVIFYNKKYFDFTMLGSIEDKVQPAESQNKMYYPVFNSYQDDYIINDLYQNINYRGGISMRGSRMIGLGTKTNRARLSFFRKDTLKLVARSTSFIFEPGRVSAGDAYVSIPIGFDSIYHPNIGLNYFVKDNRLSLFRTEDFQSQSPYYNNYHRFEMNFEQLSWNLDENRILFKMREGAASGLANFRSDNLFDAQLYFRLQGIDEENPLVTLRTVSEKEFSISFSATDYIKYSRMQLYQAKQVLKRLSILGFIIYDPDEDLVEMRQKLYDWVYASVDYIDYDVIDLISETNAPLENASLDLSTYDLTINGVPQIRLSNAQNVVIYPENARIIVKRNRDFQFDGIIDAGLFTFYGHNFLFNYDNFKINLQDIDSLSLRVKTDQIDSYGQATLLNVQSKIQDATGELFIDFPENKSGRRDYPRYPFFNSKENSYVYYDDKSIQNGVYHRDKFYFQVYPFSFDSLDNFSTSGLRLKGNFVSANIFPELEQTLLIQEDNSLGFNYVSDESGLELYGGKGQYYEHINMSNNGLRGKGKFEYLTASGSSDDLVFHPDSMFANLKEFKIARAVSGVQYPYVNSRNNEIIWYPYQDQLLVSGGSEPFTILNDSTSLAGDLILEPKGLSGSGRMDLTNSVLISDQFTYSTNMFAADTADFRLKSLHTRGFTLVTDNVNAHVDFEGRSGLFKTNEDYTLVEFPENKYISHLDYFIWNMDQHELEMGAEAAREEEPQYLTTDQLDDELIGPRYISTDPLQDSLSFISPSTVYDYQKNIIRASKVKYIKVADAFIFPANGELVVEQDGTMQQLQKAGILVNRTNRLHNLYNATVDIAGKFKYSGFANYDYIDETGEAQVIFFNEIQVDDSVQTIAEGMIAETQDFTLSPYYGYQGKVSLYANKPFLTFAGGAKLLHDCEEIDLNYLKFEAEIDPENIYIPVQSQPFDINMNYIYSGLFITRDSAHIYPAFFSRKKLPSDRYVATADGYLYYDKTSEEYRISTMDKLNNLQLPGNYLELPRTSCNEYGEGWLSLGINLGQVRLASVGRVEHNMINDSTILDVLVTMDFFMSDEALQILSADLDSLQELEAIDLTNEIYTKGIAELVGQEKLELMQTEMGLYGEYQNIPEELNHTLFFTEIKLKWNQDTRSYRSVGKIGIGSINGNQIHKLVNGYLEFTKRRSGDLFDLYLELDRRTWYYFGYTRGVMHLLSSNREFNNTINKLKTNQRKLKTKRNEIPFIFVVTTARKKELFLRGFQKEPTQ